MSVMVVVGGQYGSEGKGKICAFLAWREKMDICVRCGGPNSGHSFTLDGKKIYRRQLPCVMEPHVRLLIPAGGAIDLDVLKYEIETAENDIGGQINLGIDYRAALIEKEDIRNESESGMWQTIGSTQCGVGSATARRVMRNARTAQNGPLWVQSYLTDVALELNRGVNDGKNILIEGTQGAGLSLYSRFYPKATSRDTTAAGFASECGLSPLVIKEVVVVFRTFPIRVAGKQSGYLEEEITWEDLQKESGANVSLVEHTSVTNRVRRVGRFELGNARRAVMLNRPTRIAFNFMDHLDYRNKGVRTLMELVPESVGRIADMVQGMGCGGDCRKVYFGTGDSMHEVIEMRIEDY